jgi:hypothetical protein
LADFPARVQPRRLRSQTAIQTAIQGLVEMVALARNRRRSAEVRLIGHPFFLLIPIINPAKRMAGLRVG